MMTSLHGSVFCIIGPLWGSTPRQRPVMQGVEMYLMLAWTHRWTNNPVAGNLRRHDTHVTTLRWKMFNWCHIGFSIICHYSDAIMSVMASQIIAVSIVCSTVCSGAERHQGSASLAFVTGIHRWTMVSPHKSNAENEKMFSFDDVVICHMFRTVLWSIYSYLCNVGQSHMLYCS